MKFLIYILLFVFLTGKTVLSQSFSTSTSELFTENIGKPVLYMKNGTTVFQYYSTRKNAMLITLLDKNHATLVANKIVDFKKINFNYFFNAKHTFIFKKWVDSGSKFLIYIQYDSEFYKMTLNAQTGELENEELINKSQIPVVDLYNVNTDKITGNSFKYEEFFKSLTGKDMSGKTDFTDVSNVTFLFSDASGKEISKVSFDYTNKKYQHAQIMSYTFDNNILYIVSRQFKIYDRRSYDKAKYHYGQAIGAEAEGAICFSKYNIKTQKFEHLEMFDLKPEMYFENCKILFNPQGSTIDLRFIVKTGAKGSTLAKEGQVFYEIFFLPIDIANMKSGKPFYLPSEKLDNFVKTNCGIEEGYRGGMLDRCIIDKQGNVFATKVKNVTSYSSFSTGYIYTQNPELIGISYFDINGKEIYGAAYPYNSNGTANPYSLTFEVSKNDFGYILANSSKSNLLFLNNLSENFDLPLNKKPSYAKSLEDCNAMAIEITNDGNMKQHYVFGTPTKDNKYADFSNALYDKETNTYIVKVYDGSGYKNARVAWIQIK